jgi:hypothetical protein
VHDASSVRLTCPLGCRAAPLRVPVLAVLLLSPPPLPPFIITADADARLAKIEAAMKTVVSSQDQGE